MILLVDSNDYYFIDLALSWSDVELYCNQKCDSNLISLHSDDQWREVKYNLIPSIKHSSHVWIGLYYEDTTNEFEWSDNTTLNYGNWSDESDKTGNSGDCISLYEGVEYKYEKISCNEKNVFICNSCNYNDVSLIPSYHLSINRLT